MQQLTPNTLLQGGKYKIEKILGQGSFGITYLAEHVSLGKKVAIKEFFMKELNSRGDNERTITGITNGNLAYEYAQKFRKESRNLARLEHPNIVRVTDCFDENETSYYVMDYIEGDNLNDYLMHHQMSHSEAVSIINDVAHALQYMHEEKHMLHLDLKPGNIMRRKSDGHIFLIDFGLAKHYNADGTAETSTNIGLGTPGYAPIEQSENTARGEFKPTIDIFALGATLYKLLTRETPPSATEMLSSKGLIKERLDSNGITNDLSLVVCKAMELVVNNRIQTIREFLSALPGTVGQNSKLTEEELLYKYLHFKPLKRWRLPVLPALLTICALITTLIFSVFFVCTIIDGCTVHCYIDWNGPSQVYNDATGQYEDGKTIEYRAICEGNSRFINAPYSTSTNKNEALVEVKEEFWSRWRDSFFGLAGGLLAGCLVIYLLYRFCLPRKKHGYISDFADMFEKYWCSGLRAKYKLYIKDGKYGLADVKNFHKETEPIFDKIEWKKKNSIYYGTINGITKLYSVKVGELK